MKNKAYLNVHVELLDFDQLYLKDMKIKGFMLEYYTIILNLYHKILF